MIKISVKQYYEIPELTSAYITNTWMDETGFQPFVGGCGIHRQVATYEEAEDILWKYLKRKVKNELDAVLSRAVVLAKLQEQLADPRSMDLYKVKAKKK